MSEGVKISVIVPLYNAEATLKRCVDSILIQSFIDFELLLINDGSKDGSGKVCNEYLESDPRIRVFHKSNEGVSSARNLGLENAHGEYIVFLDSDDWIDNSYLSCQINEMLEHDVDLVDQNFTRVGFENVREKVYTINRKVKQNEIFEWIEIMFKGHTATFPKIFRKQIIDDHNLRFDVSLTLCEDLIFILDYMQFAIRGVYFSNTIGYNYVYHVNSLSNSIYSKPMSVTYEPLKKIFEFLNNDTYREVLKNIKELPHVKDKIVLLSMFFLSNLNNSFYSDRVQALESLKPYPLDTLWLSIKTKNPLRKAFYLFYKKGWVRWAVKVNDLIVKVAK